MKIQSVSVKNFRRFSDLTISDIPATAKLVVLAGPNGNGKSSLFDAFMKHWEDVGHWGVNWDKTYHSRILDAPSVQAEADEQPKIKFYGNAVPGRKSFYFRSAYRNDPDFKTTSLEKQGEAINERRFQKLIENDAAVQSNYHRLVSQGLEDVYERVDATTTIGAFRESAIGEIRDALIKVLPNLTLNSLGNPLSVGTFRFTKGAAKGYGYKNLSGGEKAAFDLILDYCVKKRDFDDTVFCIDEPEAHLNPRVHAQMLGVLFDLTNEQSQLWIATHSIGMLRKARDIEAANPGSVVILDFDVDFDHPQTLVPVKMDRVFWQRSLEVALDDVAALVAPKEIIACESLNSDGLPGEGVDSSIYNAIFAEEFPETRFVSIGSNTDLRGDRYLVVQAVANLIQGTQVRRLIDRDGMSDAEVESYLDKGYKVLIRRQIESYLFDDEVLDLLCDSVGRPGLKQVLRAAKADAISAATARGHASDDIKKCRGPLAEACKKILHLQNAGRTSNAFMRDTLAPLITAETSVYNELRSTIFG